MKGGELVKGEYDGEESYGEGILWKGGESIFEGSIYFCGRFSVEISGVRSLTLGVFGEPEVGGTGLLGVLGTGDRISLWYPGAREPDRLLLAGWVVSRFWVGFGQSIGQSLDRAAERTTREWEFSIRQRYFFLFYL